MHTSWGSDPICYLNISYLRKIFDPDDVSPWKTKHFSSWYLVPSWKVRRVCLLLDGILIIWYFAFICYLFKVVSSIMCWFWVFDRIWKNTFLVTLVCAFLVWLVFSPNCISFGSWKSCACIFTMYILWHAYFCDPIYMINSIKS